MPNLFAYGTLMCEDIMLEAAGCYPASCRGILVGYSRCPLKGEVYPAIIPDDKGRVEGILYLDISLKALKRLDRFEEELYSRQSIVINLLDKTTIPAETYCLKSEFLHCAERTEWDFENFLLHHKRSFQRDYNCYQF
jgi:gamma-glutamylcyclotransferase (GGCT)/AIG2-like uncharacterized protein YtfP